MNYPSQVTESEMYSASTNENYYAEKILFVYYAERSLCCLMTTGLSEDIRCNV